MLGKLDSCLEAGFFPTIWDSSLIHVSPGGSAKAKKDVGKLRRYMLTAYRRLARAYDTAYDSASAESDADPKLKELRTAVYEGVKACLLGELKDLEDDRAKPGRKGRKRFDDGKGGGDSRGAGGRFNRRGRKTSDGKQDEKKAEVEN